MSTYMLILQVLSVIHCSFFFFNDTATTEIYTLSLHDALPILRMRHGTPSSDRTHAVSPSPNVQRSEEHTSELQSRENLVCRLLLEKKKKKKVKILNLYNIRLYNDENKLKSNKFNTHEMMLALE